LLQINRQSIKWLQAYFDEGIATIQMPLKHKGLLSAILELIPFDTSIAGKLQKEAIVKLPRDPKN